MDAILKSGATRRSMAANDRPAPSRELGRWLTVFLIGCLTVGAYYVGVKGERRGALNRWRPIVADLVAGRDVYTSQSFPTPPIMGLILAPFTHLPGRWAMTAWFVCQSLLTAGSLALLWRMTHRAIGPFPPWVGFVILGCCVRPIVGDLLHGNVNLWILFLVVAAADLFRRERDGLCGLVLALAVACKVTPILLFAYFAWKRAWKVLAGGVAGLVLWLIVAPAGVLGPSRNLELLGRWSEGMLLPYLRDGQVETEQINQSLAGLWFRLTTPSLAIKPDDGRPPIQIHWIALDPAVAKTVLACLVAGVLLVVFWWTRRPLRDRSGMVFLHEVGLVLLAALLVSERSWKHHYVALIPTYFAVIGSAWTFTSDSATVAHRRVGRAVWFLLSGSLLLMALTSTDLARPFFGVDGSKFVQAYGAYVWAALLLAAANFLCLAQHRRDRPPPEPTPGQ